MGLTCSPAAPGIPGSPAWPGGPCGPGNPEFPGAPAWPYKNQVILLFYLLCALKGQIISYHVLCQIMKK